MPFFHWYSDILVFGLEKLNPTFEHIKYLWGQKLMFQPKNGLILVIIGLNITFFAFFFVWDPYLNCLVWEERQESKFGGSCADLHQTSKIHNGLFLHLQYQDFKTFELLKLIKNQPELLTNTFRLFNFVWLFIILGTIKNKLKGGGPRSWGGGG